MKSLSHSSRSFFKKCQWAWSRRYVDNLEHRNKKTTALWFGSGIHKALEDFYTTPIEERSEEVLLASWNAYMDGQEDEMAYVATYEEGGDFSEAVEARQLGSDMLSMYFEEYGKDEHIQCIAAEKPFEIELPFTSIQGEKKTVLFVGFIDMVYRDLRSGKIFLMENKTASRLSSGDTQYLPLDDQAGSYYVAATYILRKEGLIGDKEFISGVTYNYLQKKKRDNRPRNPQGLYCNKPQKKHYIEALKDIVEAPEKMQLKQLIEVAEEKKTEVFGEPSANQPQSPFKRVLVKRSTKQLKSQLQRLQTDAMLISAVAEETLPATKNPSRECTFCEFNELCELDESNKNWRAVAKDIYKTRTKS